MNIAYTPLQTRCFHPENRQETRQRFFHGEHTKAVNGTDDFLFLFRLKPKYVLLPPAQTCVIRVLGEINKSRRFWQYRVSINEKDRQ